MLYLLLNLKLNCHSDLSNFLALGPLDLELGESPIVLEVQPHVDALVVEVNALLLLFWKEMIFLLLVITFMPLHAKYDVKTGLAKKGTSN